MTIIFANNAVTTLAAPLLAGQTTLTVLATTGELFPVPGVGEYFKLTLEDRRNRTIEITHCIGRAGDVLTIERAKEDTTALAFAVGSTVANRFTRDSAEAIIDQVPSANPWYLGPFATAPTTDNDGNPLVAGMKYFNTGSNIEFTWTGASWIDTTGGTSAITSLSGTYTLQDPSADFDGVEDDFDLRYIDYAAAVQTPDVTIAEQFLVWLDGVRAKPGDDYTIPVLGTIHFVVPPAADVTFNGVWIALTAAGPPGPTGPTGPPGAAIPVLRNWGGTADVQTVDTGLALTSIPQYSIFKGIPTLTNTGPLTLAIDAVAAKPVNSPTGAPLAADEWENTRYYEIMAFDNPLTEYRIVQGY